MICSMQMITYFSFFFLFFSACIDHRGTPENPARTCTVEANEGTVCVSKILPLLFALDSAGKLFVFMSHIK